MNIAIFAGYYLPTIGGYAHNIHELARRLVVRGYSVTVITSTTEGPGDMDGVTVTRLPARSMLGGNYPVPRPVIHTLQRLHAIPRPDVVITQTRFFPTSLIGAIYAKSIGVPLIHVERGSCHSVVSKRNVRALALCYDHTIGTAIMSMASTVVGISQSACGFARHLGAHNTVFIPNGVSVQVPTSKDNGNNNRAINICFTGRLIYAKGVQDLIRALHHLAQHGIRLDIVGDGDYRPMLEKLAASAGAPSNITFHGAYDHDRTMKILAGSDVFVNPSYSEGMPTSVLEAAACGLPIIATDVGGTREIIEDEVSGLLVPPKNVDALVQALLWMLEHWPQAVLMGHAARETALQFGWDHIVSQWEKLINETIRRN